MATAEEKAVRITLTGAFALVLLFAGLLYWRTPGREERAKQEQQDESLIATVQNSSPNIGDSKAPITLAEFSDFQCPFCKDIAPLLDRAYAQYTGKIRRVFIFTTNPTEHPQSESAAVAALCAHKQGRFWDYQKPLFEAQDNLSPATYNQVAQSIGMDLSLFRACIADRESLNTVRAHTQFAQRVGVTATPYVTVNNTILEGSFTYSQLTSAIDRALAGSNP